MLSDIGHVFESTRIARQREDPNQRNLLQLQGIPATGSDPKGAALPLSRTPLTAPANSLSGGLQVATRELMAQASAATGLLSAHPGNSFRPVL